jgi:hypothetical protein
VIALGFEVLDPRLHSEEQIKSLLGIKVISEIPEIVNSQDQKSEKKRLALGWVMAGVMVAAMLAGSAYSFLHE